MFIMVDMDLIFWSDLNVEYVVTEENDEDDEDDDDEESDDANIYDEIAIKKEEEEFANLDKILMKQVRFKLKIFWCYQKKLFITTLY